MIGLIGVKRLMILAILLGINAALGAAAYLYLIPEADKNARQLATLKSQVSTTRTETYELENNYMLIQEQKFDYENLVKAGFFNPQDRLAFRRRMSEIQRYSKVQKARFDISPASVEKNEKVEQAQYVILRSGVTVDIDALDDIDLYNFIFWIENGFPGHASITKLRMKRENDIDEKTLRRIGSGQDLVLVSGSIDYNWRTMVPRDSVGNNFQAFGDDFR